MRLTFEEWFDIWWTSGYWFKRGRGVGTYCMSRYNDLGDYEIGNVFIQTNEQNTRDARFYTQVSLTDLQHENARLKARIIELEHQIAGRH